MKLKNTEWSGSFLSEQAVVAEACLKIAAMYDITKDVWLDKQGQNLQVKQVDFRIYAVRQGYEIYVSLFTNKETTRKKVVKLAENVTLQQIRAIQLFAASFLPKNYLASE